MADDGIQQSQLIDRLTATTLRLRNLFYINVILAAAILYLVFQDPAFLSERIGSAAATLEPSVSVAQKLKENEAASYNFQLELGKAVSLVESTGKALHEAFARLDSLPEADRSRVQAELERRLTTRQRALLEDLVNFDGYAPLRRRIQDYFELDLMTMDYHYVAEFAAFLVYAEYVVATLEQGRRLVLAIDEVLPLELPERRALLAGDFSRIDLRYFTQAVVYDSAVQAELRELPPRNAFIRAVMIVDTFCRANELGNCSLAGIRRWQEQRAAAASSKLSAPGLEVNVARDLIVPASPLAFFVAFHIYAMQYRRRQVLRRRLIPSLPLVQLNLLDEPWLLNSLVLNLATAEGWWRRAQSAIMAILLLLAQAAPLAAVLVAGYYTFKQVLLGAFIAEEFTSNLATLAGIVRGLGVHGLPEPPPPPGLFWEYLWIAVAGFSAMALSVGLCQIVTDQIAEIRAAWRLRGEA